MSPPSTPTPMSTTNTDSTPTLLDERIPEGKIAAAADLTVFDARGNRIRFGALFELERTVVVFIRECALLCLFWGVVGFMWRVSSHVLVARAFAFGCGLKGMSC
jgi:hypothetical protein